MWLRLSLLTFLSLGTCKAIAEPAHLFQKETYFSRENLEKTMHWFCAEPHPMGSNRQKAIANILKTDLEKDGWKSNIDAFQTDQIARDVTGFNVIGTKTGAATCSILFSGHYDTKYFSNFRFVGANDGGSQTALLLELARIIGKKKPEKNSWGECTIGIVFFDGEESVLAGWDQATQMGLGLGHTYGSREFVKRRIEIKHKKSNYDKKPIKIVFVFDMIGHKNQDLFITKGSDAQTTKEFLSFKRGLKIKFEPLFIEDDHIPFLQKRIPFLHTIDWTNLNEWHTEKDTFDIISYDNISLFGDMILAFLDQERREF